MVSRYIIAASSCQVSTCIVQSLSLGSLDLFKEYGASWTRKKRAIGAKQQTPRLWLSRSVIQGTPQMLLTLRQVLRSSHGHSPFHTQPDLAERLCDVPTRVHFCDMNTKTVYLLCVVEAKTGCFALNLDTLILPDQTVTLHKRKVKTNTRRVLRTDVDYHRFLGWWEDKWSFL